MMAAGSVVKRNPKRNVDNLFPTTKGKNIVCLLKKNVTTWPLGRLEWRNEDHML